MSSFESVADAFTVIDDNDIKMITRNIIVLCIDSPFNARVDNIVQNHDF